MSAVHPRTREHQARVAWARELVGLGLSRAEIVACLCHEVSADTARKTLREAGLRHVTLSQLAREYLRENPQATAAMVERAVGCSERLARLVRQQWRKSRGMRS